jgi:RNA polymerase sigma-70 factor (ECF subfamily)
MQSWDAGVATDWELGVARAAPVAEVSVDWSSRDDAALIRACLDGHPDAFAPIVERYQRQVYHVCFRFAGNHADAADLAQDVFIRAYRGLGGFRGGSSIHTWLYRIAVNASLNRVAQKTPRLEALGDRDVDTAVERPDAALLRVERAAEVRAAIARLPAKQRATLILRIYHDLPHHEIAAVLGSSVGAVKANFFHALANLRKLLT